MKQIYGLMLTFVLVIVLFAACTQHSESGDTNHLTSDVTEEITTRENSQSIVAVETTDSADATDSQVSVDANLEETANAKPADLEPAETLPAEIQPQEITSVETKPTESESAETPPAETTSKETEPIETDPMEATSVETKPVHTHIYSKETIDPSCSKKGYTTYTCSCGESSKSDYTDAAGHSYKKTVTKPTCTEQGYTTYKCSKCGDNYKDTYVDATGHNYSKTVNAPTCIQKGYNTYTCVTCGDSYKADHVDVTAHNYKKTVTAPTCTKNGHTTYKCTICDDSYNDDYTDATGHAWGEWRTSVEATYNDMGEKERTCSICNETETKMIEKLEMTTEMKQQEVLRLVNIEREKEGLAPLEYYNAGQKVADTRAKEITTYFSHERPNGTMCWTALTEQNIHFYGAGENIAFGYASPGAVVEGWMNSEGHRANILNPSFTHLIVGVEGTYWVQLFLTI